MPPILVKSPQRLENLCISEINRHLFRELHLVYQIRRFQNKSLLLRRRAIDVETLQAELLSYLDKLPPLLNEMVHQELLDRLMKGEPPSRKPSENPPCSIDKRLALEMLEILLNGETPSFEFHHRHDFPADSRIWQLILHACTGLKRFGMVSDMYSSDEKEIFISPFLKQLSINCPMLSELAVMDAITDCEVLEVIGKNCHHLKKLDLTGAPIGCGDIYSLCIPSAKRQVLTNYIAVQDEMEEGRDGVVTVNLDDFNPVCQTLTMLILSKTKVRSQGAGVLLRIIPNLTTLGTLAYNSASLKSLYHAIKTKLWPSLKLQELYHRGPLNIKFKVLAYSCPDLEMLKLSSSSVRRLPNQSIFVFKKVHTLTLSNFHSSDIELTLQHTPFLTKLEVDCLHLDISVVARHCPLLIELVIKKEPLRELVASNFSISDKAFQALQIVKIEAPVSLAVAGFFFQQAMKIKVLDIVRIRHLTDEVFRGWFAVNPLNHVEKLILHFSKLTFESVNLLLDSCPMLIQLGEIGGWDLRSWECRRIKTAVETKRLDIDIVVYSEWTVNFVDIFNNGVGSMDFDSDG